jgi:hypothetical protein
MRSKEPIEILKTALEQTTDTPTTTLINQLIGNDKNKTVDIKDMIAADIKSLLPFVCIRLISK